MHEYAASSLMISSSNWFISNVAVGFLVLTPEFYILTPELL